MKKAIGILIALAVVVLVVLFVVFPKKHAGVPGISLENYVPKSAVAYYSIKDMQGTWGQIRNSEFYKEISLLPLWKEVQAQQAVGNFLRAFKDGFGFELTEQRIMDVVGDELAIAVLMGAPADPEPKILFLTRTGTKTQLAEMVGRLMDKAKSAGNQKIETWSHNGFNVHNVKSADPTAPELNYVFLDNLLVLGVGKTRSAMQSVVDLYKGKSDEAITSSENFKKFAGMASSVKGSNLGVFYMDFEQIAKAVAAGNVNVPGAVGTNITQTLSLLKLIGGVTTLENGLFTKIFILPNKDGMDPATRALWEIKPQPLTSLRFVPEGTVLYSVTNSMDVKRLWGIWKENLQKQAPAQSQTILSAIAQAETNMGMTVEGDLLSWIGDEIAYTFNDVNLESVFPIPKMSLLIKVTDQAKAQAFIDKMIDYANNQTAQPVTTEAVAIETTTPAPAAGATTPGEAQVATETVAVATTQPAKPPLQLKFEDSSYGGVAIKSISIPLVGKGLAPGYAFLGDYLVLSTSAATLEKIIDVYQGKANSLLKDPNFISVSAEVPEKTNQMGYINTQRIFDIAIDICNWIISFQQLNAPAAGSPNAISPSQADATSRVLRETVIPLLRAMKAVRVVSISTTYTDEGIEQIISTHLQDPAPLAP